MCGTIGWNGSSLWPLSSAFVDWCHYSRTILMLLAPCYSLAILLIVLRIGCFSGVEWLPEQVADRSRRSNVVIWNRNKNFLHIFCFAIYDHHSCRGCSVSKSDKAFDVRRSSSKTCVMAAKMDDISRNATERGIKDKEREWWRKSLHYRSVVHIHVCTHSSKTFLLPLLLTKWITPETDVFL